MKEQSY